MFASSQMFSNQSQSAGSPEKKARQEEKLTCVPVTVRTIESAIEQAKISGQELCFYGQEQGMLALVALAETVVRQAASLEISASDSTGRVLARHYFSGDAGDFQDVTAGRYVSMVGSVRTSPEPHFAITSVRAVQSADEISYHMIEAAYTALTLTRLKDVAATPSPEAAVTAATAEQLKPAKGPVEPPTDVHMAAGHVAVAPAAAPKVAPEGPALREAILTLLKGYGEAQPEGLAVDAICERVAPGKTDAVRAMLVQLVDEAELYNTINDEHFNVL